MTFMDIILTLIMQILQMFMIAGLGFLLFKKKLVTNEGSKALGKILIYLTLPAVIIRSFLIDRNPQNIRGIIFSAIAALALQIIAIIISRLFFKKDPIAVFASTFSNPGFFGIPLIIASIGQEAVIFTACFIAFLNILQWTYGASLLTGQKPLQGFSLKQFIRAPFFIAFFIGIILFFTQLQLPIFIQNGLNSIASMNTPVAMLGVGIYMAQTNLLSMFRKAKLYKISFVRLILIPVICVLIGCLIPESLQNMKLALLISAACPVGSNIAVYAQLHNQDYTYSVETVVLSTLLSIITIPLIITISKLLW